MTMEDHQGPWKISVGGNVVTGTAKNVMFPPDDKVGSYQKCAPRCLGGFCRGDRKLAVAVEKLLCVRVARQDGEIAQDSRDSFI